MPNMYMSKSTNHQDFSPDLKALTPLCPGQVDLQFQSELVPTPTDIQDFRPFIGIYAKLLTFVKVPLKLKDPNLDENRRIQLLIKPQALLRPRQVRR